MKLNTLIAAVALALSSTFIYQSCISEASAGTQPQISMTAKQWSSIDNAIQASKKDNKRIIVDVYTDWCKWCKVMDEKTFQNAEIKSYLEEKFNLAKFNAEQTEDIVYKGNTYSFRSNGRKGNHSLAMELLDGQLSYPSLVILDAELNKLEVIRGYKTPEQLIKILNSI